MKLHPYIRFPQKGVAARSNARPWRVPDLCASYGWPAGLAGGGRIAIVELGGGWVWNDVGRFCGALGQPVPKIGDFSVDGAMNNGSTSDPASAEVALDIQVAAASYFAATGKPATIRIYWANNSGDAIGQAIEMAAGDGCDTFSCSWGAREAAWGSAAATKLEVVSAEATASGMAIFAASGDNGSMDVAAPSANVDFPAAAPHVVGCGGTRRPHNPNSSRPEIVWNGTGGGYSKFFPTQPWQSGAPLGPGGRMVPDVAANADPQTGYHIMLGGRDIVVGGTSAVAPLYAGLFAAFGRKLGWVTPRLFMSAAAFYDITVAGNGLYMAGPGPDPCSGLGTPRGQELASLFATHLYTR